MSNRISLYALFLVAAVIVILNFRESPYGLISWDQFGYYLYLPLAFIYHDLGITDYSLIETLMDKYQPVDYFYQGVLIGDGSYVLRYTAGLAFLYAPGFFIGHLFAWLLNYPMDGFSLPYQYSVMLTSMAFLFLGLYCLRLVLLRFFSDAISAFVLVAVYFGTNFLNLSTHNGILTVHPHLFTLFSVLMLYTIKWHEEKKISSALVIGVCLGWSALIRPSEILYSIIPLGWGAASLPLFLLKIKLLFSKYLRHTLLILFTMACFGFVQFIYWKYKTGHFFYDSYGANPGEGFDIPPHTIDFLFSYRKGWLVYTPVMLFALAGFFMVWKKGKEFFWASLVFFLSFLLLVSSWTTWWFGGCYSQRTMLQIYPLMALLLGFFVQWAISKGPIIKWISVSTIVCLIGLNLFQTWQYENNILDWSRMTKKYYWEVFLKTSVPEGAEKLLLISRDDPDAVLKDESLYEKKVLFGNEYEKDPGSVQQVALKDTLIGFQTRAFVMDSTREFLNLYRTQADSIMNRSYAWIRVHIEAMPLGPVMNPELLFVIEFVHEGKGYNYRTYPVLDKNSVRYEWHTAHIDYLTPDVRSGSDKVNIYLWNRGKEVYAVDDLRVELFEPLEDE